jgi:RsmE family RNA methyltransferase
MHTALPRLDRVDSVARVIGADSALHRYIATPDPDGAFTLARVVAEVASHRCEGGCTVCVGPERGFTDTETTQFLDAGYTPVSLGRHTLRTETACTLIAGVVAASATDGTYVA